MRLSKYKIIGIVIGLVVFGYIALQVPIYNQKTLFNILSEKTNEKIISKL